MRGNQQAGWWGGGLHEGGSCHWAFGAGAGLVRGDEGWPLVRANPRRALTRGCLPCSEEGSCCCCCAAVQGLLLLFCALAPEEVNEVRLGPLTPYAVLTLRHVREFFGVTFSIRPERDSQTIFLSCIGAGVRNLSKKIT